MWILPQRITGESLATPWALRATPPEFGDEPAFFSRITVRRPVPKLSLIGKLRIRGGDSPEASHFLATNPNFIPTFVSSAPLW